MSDDVTMGDDVLLRLALLSVGVGLLATAGLAVRISMGIMAMLLKAPGAAAAGYDATILAEPSLLHYWPLDEAAGAGTALDARGTLNGTNAGITAGSTALLSDGHTSYLGSSTAAVSFGSVPVPTSGAFSVECWLLPGGTSNTSLWEMGSGWTTDGYALLIDGSSLFRIIMGGTGTSASAGSTPGASNHLVLTYNGTTAVLYKNGTSILSTSASYAAPTSGGRVFTDLALGRHYTGNIAKVATYNAALTSTQVAAHYAAR